MALSRRLIILTILLYNQFIHHTQINLRPNKHSAACLSVIFELHPALTPFASLWHAGRILDKNVNINMNYSYPTTMYESKSTQRYVFLVLFAIFAFYREKNLKQKLQ